MKTKKGLLKNMLMFELELKSEIKPTNSGEINSYGKDSMKIKFNSDDDFSLNRPPKFYAMSTIIRSVFEEGGKLYPEFFLLCMNYKNAAIQKI